MPIISAWFAKRPRTDLEKLSDQGQFNEELFYRVAVLPVHLPSLRDRLEDIPLLLKRTSRPRLQIPNLMPARSNSPRMPWRHFKPMAGRAIWPEFRQMISQIVATTETRIITSAQLPLRVHELTQWPTLADYLTGQEKQYIARVLHACQGDKARAALALDIDISLFWIRLLRLAGLLRL